MSDKQYSATFILPDGSRKTVTGEAGTSLLHLAHDNKIPLEGACEASLACSTCHVIVHDGWFDGLPEAKDEEEDMLDYAFGLTPTSRLGCQIILGPDTDGIVVEIPKETRNMQLKKA
jgi:2Fe-2S ferredoxin